ncbi:MAG: M48 family metalloprotease [Bacteroidota bacterium]|nr:M48 family metalloprotease [Candidatus Kapabacteria bacterium]MDW8219196.1 M48 family metalloprotease [Bacteroidota bacterium]
MHHYRIPLRFRLLFSVITALSLVSLHCSGGINMFSTETDAQLGKQMDDQIRRNPQEYPIFRGNPAIRQYLQDMTNTIIRSEHVQYRGIFPYIVEVIHDDNTINAFCTPGGYIYVYTGLMKAVDNEATLAGVMGHEIAHAERRHGTSRMTKAYGLQILLQVALGQNPSQLATIGANLFSGLALLKNSRMDEEEADAYSFKYLQSTPWYPGAIKFFFEKVMAASGRAPQGSQSTLSAISSSVERLLSTHPLPQDRIDATNRRIAEANLPPPSETNLRSVPYRRIRQLLP